MDTLDKASATLEELAEHYLDRVRRGERPSLTEYVRGNAELADEIRDVFPTLLMMEEARPSHPVYGASGANALWSEAASVRIDDYRIVRVIGQGGMGIVYEAEQESLGRRVALKVLPFRPGIDPKCVLRFRREARSAARLHHTNIVPVFHVGHCDGLHYYAMQFIEGLPLDRVIDRLRKHAAECSSDQRPFLSSDHYRFVAQIGMQIAGALEYAHQQNVLHRDIKPSNLLLDERKTVWLSDFGLAKPRGDDLTNTGDIVGTLRYMAPERLSGISTARSDIYSAGLTLYELLTLRAVLEGTDRACLLRQIAMQPMVRPRSIDPLVPPDLETILMKAAAKDPLSRYATAAEMREDLRRFLDDEPIRARRCRTAERLWRACRRNPVMTGLVLALLITLVSGFAAVAWKWREADLAHRSEHDALAIAEQRTNEVQRGLENLQRTNTWIERGRWYLEESRWDDAHAAFTAAISLRPDHVSLWLERAELYTRLGLWDLAAADYRQNFQLHESDTAFRWMQHALLCYHQGDLAGYRDACQRMRKRFAGTLRPRFVEEVVRSHLFAPQPTEDLEAMVRTLQEIVEHSPRSSLYILGKAHYRSGQFERALQRLQEGLAIPDRWPLSDLAHPVMAMAYHQLGNTDDAHASLKKAEAKLQEWTNQRLDNADSPWVVHGGATSRWPVPWWDYLECELTYGEAYLMIEGRELPEGETAHVLRARSLAGLRWLQPAQDEYRRALEVDPANARVQLEFERCRGLALIHQQPKVALASFSKACELAPDDAYLWRTLAVACVAADDHAKYRQVCRTMVDRFRNTDDATTAANVLLACLLQAGALEEMQDLESFLPCADRRWHWGDWVHGAALYRLGNPVDAARYFESIANHYRRRPWDSCFLAMAYHRTGRFDDAMTCLREAQQWIATANQATQDDITATRPVWGDWYERIIFPRLIEEASDVLSNAGVAHAAQAGVGD